MIKTADNILTTFETWLQKQRLPELNVLWFRRCTYALVVLKMLFIWPELSMFYHYTVGQYDSFLSVNRFFFNSLFQNTYHIVWGLCCVIPAMSVFVGKNIWLSVIVFIIYLNYFTLTLQADNSSDKLLMIFLFAQIFIKEKAAYNSVRELANNAIFLLLKVHFCVLYFLNASGKMVVPMWQDGSCMDYVWNLAYFANTNIIPGWFLSPAVSLITAWSVMLFEMLFAILIWFKPFKKWLLIAGVFFHVGIAIFLSLPDFSLTVLVLYILFIEPLNKKRTTKTSQIL